MVSPVVPLSNTPLLMPAPAPGRSLTLALPFGALPDAGDTAASPDGAAGPVAARLPASCARPDAGDSTSAATVIIASFRRLVMLHHRCGPDQRAGLPRVANRR